MISSTDRTAFKALLELVRNPQPRSAHAVVKHDWSRLPRIHEAGFSALDPVNYQSVAAVARRLLLAACDELDDPERDRSDQSHPLDIFRQHHFEEGATWDSILAYRREHGLPLLSARTLRNRQNTAIQLLLDWAARPSPSPQKPVPAQSEAETTGFPAPVGSAGAPPDPAPPPPPSIRRPLFRRRLVVLGSVALMLGLLLLVASHPSGQPELLEGANRALLGRSLSAFLHPPPKETSLWRFLDPDELPPIDGEYSSATIVEEEGYQFVYLGTSRSGSDATRVIKWDPRRHRILWSRSFDPPLQERFTHAGVLHEPVTREKYMVRWLASGVAPERETRGILAVLWSRYSPTFVYEIDRRDGHEWGHYVHPGQLFTPRVTDLDGDHRGEYLLGGIDNPQERPVLVILNQLEGTTAASDVLWNTGGREGARARILLATHPQLRLSMGIGHWVDMIYQEIPDLAATGRLTTGVGNRSKHGMAYYATLLIDHGRIDGVDIHFTEFQGNLWARVGMSLDEAKRYIEARTTVLQSLPNQDELAGDAAAALGEQMGEVHSGGDRRTGSVTSIPAQAVHPGVEMPGPERPDPPAGDAVDLK